MSARNYQRRFVAASAGLLVVSAVISLIAAWPIWVR
jgi:hypothetical protein